MLPRLFLLIFLLLPLTVNAQFLMDPQGLRDIFGPAPAAPPEFRASPDFGLGPAPAALPSVEEPPATEDGTRFNPMASIRITPSKADAPSVEESLDMVSPHEWSKMTVFLKTGSDGMTLNDRFAHVLSTWIRTTKGLMAGRPLSTTTPSPVVETTSPVMPTTFAPPPSVFDGLPTAPQMVAPPTPPPTEFVNREDLLTTRPPKTEVFDPRMPTIVEGWPLGGEFIKRNPLIEEEDGQYPAPTTFAEMLKICPMYPETATMFVHEMVRREYSAHFETRVQCRCGEGSHESFFARKSRPMLTEQGPSLDPAFQKSDLIVGRFSCAFPGTICVQTENGVRLRSMDWQAHAYPAVGSGGGWANSYILLMENGTRLEDVDTGKVYLGATQFEGDRRKSRLEHSYMRIKSISCDGCLHTFQCQR